MTKEELDKIKGAAPKIHAALWRGAPPDWEPPSWEEAMMRIVTDICAALVAWRGGRRADLRKYDNAAPAALMGAGDVREYDAIRMNSYRGLIARTAEGYMAQTVLDCIDALEAFNLWSGCKPFDWKGDIPKRDENAAFDMAGVCYYLTEMALNPFRMTGGLLNILNALRWWCVLENGIDLRRHVELRLDYVNFEGAKLHR